MVIYRVVCIAYSIGIANIARYIFSVDSGIITFQNPVTISGTTILFNYSIAILMHRKINVN